MALSHAAHRRLGKDLYGLSNFQGTLLRHFLAVRALPRRVITCALVRALVAPPGVTQRSASRRTPTHRAAVPISTIASSAQEEDLPTIGSSADDESERIHVPGEDGAKNWTTGSCRATNSASHHVPWTT